MSFAVNASRPQTWLESLGEWSWPGQGGASGVEVLPPPWVPVLPRRERAATPLGGVSSPARRSPSARVRRVITGTLLGLLAGVCIALAHSGQLTLGGLINTGDAVPVEAEAPVIGSAPTIQSLPTLEPVSQDGAGSWIDRASYHTTALGGEGSFLVYLPADYDSTTPCSTCSPARTSPTKRSCRSAFSARSTG
jgi:hypothetical protein